MPVYEYQCESCNRVTEALRRMAEADDAIVCEHCGAENTKRKHSVFAAASESAKGTPLPMGGGCPCGDPSGPCNFK